MSLNKKIIKAAGGIVLNPDKDILFIYRRGKWDLPKGKLEEGETLEDCAVREVEEECGLKNIILHEFVGITTHEYFDKWINEDVIKESYWYEMEIKSMQPLIPQTEEDIEDIRWVSMIEIDKYLNDSYVNIIEIINKWRTV